MSGPMPRPNPDRKAAEKYARGQRSRHIPATPVDLNAQSLGEQSLAVRGSGWGFPIYRLVRRLIVGRRD